MFYLNNLVCLLRLLAAAPAFVALLIPALKLSVMINLIRIAVNRRLIVMMKGACLFLMPGNLLHLNMSHNTLGFTTVLPSKGTVVNGVKSFVLS